MMFPFQTKEKNPGDLPYFEQDLAAFMLTRGPHAFIGHSWLGCSKQYDFPEPLNKDYVSSVELVTMLTSALCQCHRPFIALKYCHCLQGVPTGLCKETKSGVFEREWTKASVKMDCGTYTGSVTMKDTGKSVFTS